MGEEGGWKEDEGQWYGGEEGWKGLGGKTNGVEETRKEGSRSWGRREWWGAAGRRQLKGEVWLRGSK